MQNNKLKIRKWALIILIIITVGLLACLMPAVQNHIVVFLEKHKLHISQEYIFRKIILGITLSVMLIISLWVIKGKVVKLWVCLLWCLIVLLFSRLVMIYSESYLPYVGVIEPPEFSKFSKEIAIDGSVGFVYDSTDHNTIRGCVAEIQYALAPRKIIYDTAVHIEAIYKKIAEYKVIDSTEYVVGYNINKEIAGYKVIDSTEHLKLYKKQK